MSKRILESLGTIITGLEHGLRGGSIRAFSAIIFNSFSAACCLARGIRYGLCLIGRVPGKKSTLCSTKEVRPRSWEEAENTS